MRGMKRRVDRLERYQRTTYKCPECGGAGRLVYTNDHPDNVNKPIEGCPVCGKAFVIHFYSKDHKLNPPTREVRGFA